MFYGYDRKRSNFKRFLIVVFFIILFATLGILGLWITGRVASYFHKLPETDFWGYVWRGFMWKLLNNR